MSCLARKVVENRIKQKEAKENGNVNALICLMIVGGLLFAGHSMLTQMGHLHRSMKDIFRSLVGRNTVRQVGSELAKSEGQKIAEVMTQDWNNENER